MRKPQDPVAAYATIDLNGIWRAFVEQAREASMIAKDQVVEDLEWTWVDPADLIRSAMDTP